MGADGGQGAGSNWKQSTGITTDGSAQSTPISALAKSRAAPPPVANIQEELALVAPALGIQLRDGKLSDADAESINAELETEHGLYI